MHDLGYAHSIEVWEDKKLKGGLYGVAIGKVFFAESMFSTSSNGSKLALIALMGTLALNQFLLLDVQFMTDHLRNMGAKEISRALFLNLIKVCCHRLQMTKVDVIQGRSFLQLPLTTKKCKVDTPHIDTKDDHFVMLYYVCDSDGDTIIYNEQEKSDSYTVQKRITPKQGRVVLFDGSYYHTAEQPLNNIRCVVNYDFK